MAAQEAFDRVGVDVEGFIKDGYVVVRGAFDQDTATHCRELIWAELRRRGIREDQPTTWPAHVHVHVHIDSVDGEPFTLPPALQH